MHLLSIASLLLFAAAVGGYAYLFRQRHRQRMRRLREADAQLGRAMASRYGSVHPAGHPPHGEERSRGASSARRAHRVPSTAYAGQLSEWVSSIVVQLVWVPFFTVLIGIGVVVPGAGALTLFHHAGLLTEYPLTPASLFQVARYAFWTAAILVMLGMLGLRRYGPFLACFLAGLFACSFIAAILFSSLLILPVQLVVSPLFGIDAWIDWRPFVHLAFVVLGVPWAFSICYEARRDLLGDDRDFGYGGYRFRGNAGTAVGAGGALFSGLFDDSGGAGGSWSDDSGGGDPD